MLRAQARLSADRQRIEVLFPYSLDGLAAIHEVGGNWSPSKRVWTVALDLTTARRLREEFGAGLTIEPELRRWAKAERRRRAMRRQLSQANGANLVHLPRSLPALAALLAERPYQSADIARMAIDNVINANEPGTGKTIEIIGTAAEARLLDKPALTIAPVRSIENTWAAELERVGYPHRVIASEDARQRKADLLEAAALAEEGEPFWLVVNPDLIRVKPLPDGGDLKSVVARDPVNGQPYVAPYPELFGIPWGLVSLDEFHQFGLTNTRSQFGLAARLLGAERMILASGTPIGGKYKRLWAALNWLYPKEYGSWWRWATQWLVIEDNGFGKVVKDKIQPGREEEFIHAHAHHFLRRTKLADLPGCPPKVHRVVWCGMTRDQERQYREFEREAEIHMAGHRLAGHGILAEWSQLRLLANATCTIKQRGRRLALVPTPDSGKLPYLLAALAEVGIRKQQPEPGRRAIVGSMSKGFAKIVSRYLNEHGIATGLLTGETADSKPILKAFRDGGDAPYVLVMTIQTGGVSLNLQEASAVIALDESWNPDQITQFFDRGDRGSRTTPLLCVTMRTRGTIQEYVAEIAEGKEINNRNVHKYAPRVRSRATRASSQSR